MKVNKKIITQYSIILLIIINLFSIHIVSSETSILDPYDVEPKINLPEYRAVLVAGRNDDLPYSIKQLNGFKTTLLNGGNWRDENIKDLTYNSATKIQIIYALNWLGANADENDISLFYFIGHGSGNSTNQCIIPYDDPIYDVELDEYLDSIYGKVIVIIDACRSGGFIDELESMNRVILTACAEDEATYQVRDLESGMFGFFLNMSLAWFTKSTETTFYATKILTWFYGKKISEEYEGDYMIHPQMSNGIDDRTLMIYRHAYVKQLTHMIIAMMDMDHNNMYWRM